LYAYPQLQLNISTSGSAGSVLSYCVNGEGSLHIWAIFCYILLST